MNREILRNRLEMYLQIEQKILLSGQSYTIGNRTLTRADLKEVRAIIDDLSAQLDVLERRGGSQKRVVLID